MELFINGISQGIRRKADSHQYHVMWRVTFQPGEVRVVARKDGKDVREKVIHTAGAPHHLKLIADRTSMPADGKSLTFVTVEVVDSEGNLCPRADNQVFFELNGATIAGVDNGCQTSLERFKADNRHAFNGRGLVVIRADRTPGPITLSAKAPDLQSASLTLEDVNP